MDVFHEEAGRAETVERQHTAYMKDQEFEKAKSYREENKPYMGKASGYRDASYGKMAYLNKELRRVRGDSSLTPDEMSSQIAALQTQKREFARLALTGLNTTQVP